MKDLPRIVINGVVGPVDASRVPRFNDLATFARLPRLDDVSDVGVAIVGVPFDGGTSFRPGARFGPSHVRDASRLLRPYNPELAVSPFAAVQIADAGDIVCTPFSIDGAVAAIEAAARELGERTRRIVTIGGDHTIALPLLRAAAATHGPVAVIHFDTHLDTWDTYFDAPITHGTPFRRASEEGLLDREACLHVGTRGPLYDVGDLLDDKHLGFALLPSIECLTLGISGVLERITDRVGDRPVYVSVDIDVLDPAFAPGTGTPEPGGLSSRELLAFLRGLAGLNVIGADVVEVAPAYDHTDITSFAAAHAVYELVSVLALGLAPTRLPHDGPEPC